MWATLKRAFNGDGKNKVESSPLLPNGAVVLETRLSLGMPSDVTALAVDHIQHLLAVGTRTGRVKVFGHPGVDVTIGNASGHDQDLESATTTSTAAAPVSLAVSALTFSANQGLLISAAGSTVRIHSLRTLVPTTAVVDLPSTVTALAAPTGGSWLYCGTEAGDVCVVDLERGSLTVYHISSEALGFPGAPPLVAIAQDPSTVNQLLIATAAGVVLWKLEEQKVAARFAAAGSGDPEAPVAAVTAIAWHRESKLFAVGDAAGNVAVWSVKKTKKARKVFVNPGGAGAGGAPVTLLAWAVPKGAESRLMAAAGSALSVIYDEDPGKVAEIPLPAHMAVAAGVLVGDVPWEYLPSRASLVAVAGDDGRFALVDTLDPVGGDHLLPLQFRSHASPITCLRLCDHAPLFFTTDLFATGRTMFGAEEWVFDGGSFSELGGANGTDNGDDDCASLAVTGHADGSIRIWDISTVSLTLLTEIMRDDYAPLVAVDGSDAGVAAVAFCPNARLLAIATAASELVVFSFNMSAATFPVYPPAGFDAIFDAAGAPLPQAAGFQVVLAGVSPEADSRPLRDLEVGGVWQRLLTREGDNLLRVFDLASGGSLIRAFESTEPCTHLAFAETLAPPPTATPGSRQRAPDAVCIVATALFGFADGLVVGFDVYSGDEVVYCPAAKVQAPISAVFVVDDCGNEIRTPSREWVEGESLAAVAAAAWADAGEDDDAVLEPPTSGGSNDDRGASPEDRSEEATDGSPPATPAELADGASSDGEEATRDVEPSEDEGLVGGESPTGEVIDGDESGADDAVDPDADAGSMTGDDETGIDRAGGESDPDDVPVAVDSPATPTAEHAEVATAADPRSHTPPVDDMPPIPAPAFTTETRHLLVVAETTVRLYTMPRLERITKWEAPAGRAQRDPLNSRAVVSAAIARAPPEARTGSLASYLVLLCADATVDVLNLLHLDVAHPRLAAPAALPFADLCLMRDHAGLLRSGRLIAFSSRGEMASVSVFGAEDVLGLPMSMPALHTEPVAVEPRPTPKAGLFSRSKNNDVDLDHVFEQGTASGSGLAAARGDGSDSSGGEGSGDANTLRAQRVTAEARSELDHAREALAERGEKIAIIEDKSAEMANAAENFADMAKKFRQQQESSWF